ncbi:MAG: Serine phosphatase RsbU, regulator of sigma subunit [uncultured Corynebacteriales bacterium]|uniref:Serine phosphatase RsbU, regulator of sigma subunit n=1 Tax=uncultured Mycobacteriales bacterium TaxID=581187 RepID=A0A6J4IX09_9ACTN|nr:MAG: Serine phosphatase RsbU, regulator of sigma subunit [uncultured Corynebacteriales bacterium]
MSSLLPVVGTAAPVESLRVLLVEDDDGDAFLVQELLDEAVSPVELLRARTLAEAEEWVGRVDCVLLDLGLPDASGLDGLRRLAARADGIALLVLTGLADEHRGAEAVAAGAQDYLVKGQVDGQLLTRAIRYAIGRSRIEATERALHEQQLHAEENTRLERGLLPSPLIAGAGVLFAARYQAGGRRLLLGGDFYDAVRGPDGILHVLIGDVSGHGPDEAALGVRLRIAWRALVLAARPADEILATLQQVLVHERHREHIFATVCTLTIAADRRNARVHLVGHPAPLLVGGGARLLSEVKVVPPLGVVTRTSWPSTEVELPADWALLLHTDGLIDGRVGHGPERLDGEGLTNLVKRQVGAQPDWRGAPEAFVDALIQQAEELNGGDLVDDVAVLLVGALPPAEPTDD